MGWFNWFGGKREDSPAPVEEEVIFRKKEKVVVLREPLPIDSTYFPLYFVTFLTFSIDLPAKYAPYTVINNV